jgi:hypothetical protein
MNAYKNETVEQLKKIIDMMVADKNVMIREGMTKIANQDQQVIDAVVAESKGNQNDKSKQEGKHKRATMGY